MKIRAHAESHVVELDDGSHLMIIAENSGRGIQGDGAVSDFSDADGGDGGCGD
ncbi:hypothetical protein [Bradyrhizobium sp. cf659]|uniref:hypothetical protein n=1 Tax=Bradyrhizobium sp. cf659 TaxID=1761771 RepID=UPI000AAF7C4C|nr:hypothetical protein [Bradyrhizobium sp. cf659]